MKLISCECLGSLLQVLEARVYRLHSFRAKTKCHATSVVGRTFPITRLAKRFGITVRRRGFTHSLSFVGAAGIALLPLILIERVDCYLAFLLSVLQHQILDGLTPDGLLWLTPFWNVPFRLSPNPSLTVPNGSGKEGVLRWCLIALMLMLLVINLIGPRWMLNYYFADTQAAVELIYRWGSRYSLKARFKATHMLTQEEIEGCWRVVGHSDRKLILETDHGELMSMVDDYDNDATLKADKIRLYRENPVKTASYRVDMEASTLGELESRMEADKPHRLFAEHVLLEEPCYIEQDVELFSPVRVSGRSLTLRFATLEHLGKLRDHGVEKGEILVVYRLGMGDTMKLSLDQPKRVWEHFEVDDPGEIVVCQGTMVREGDILAQIARRIRLLGIKQEEGENTQARLDRRKKIHTESLQYLDSQTRNLALKIGLQEDELEEYREQLRASRATREDVEQRVLQLRSLRMEQNRLELQEERAQASYEEERSQLILELRRISNAVSILETEAYIRAQTSGEVKRIVSKRKGDTFRVRIHIETR